ncbi:MAG: hypothetical protein KDC06_08450 [Chitinophagaceae bacterium]|nr:hypothetical protein [Chitinophagaceae bacterium]
MKKFIFVLSGLLFTTLSFAQRKLILPEQTENIFPRWVNGDRDFWGHGPILSGNVSVAIADGKAQLIAFINLRLEEDGGDHSAATINETRLIYNAPAGKQIRSIITPTSLTSNWNQKLKYSENRIHGPRNTPVSELRVRGDGESKDIGNDTKDDSYIAVKFGPMVIELEPLSSGIREVTLNKSLFGGVLNDKFRGSHGKINTYGPRHGNSWFKPHDAWIKFPDAIRRDTLFFTDLKEILISPRRYNYNDIRLQSITARPSGKYLMISVNWEGDGKELIGHCVNDIGCGFGSPSVQLDDLKILIKVRPFTSGGKLTFDPGDVQVGFSYKYSADCGILTELCKEIFKDPLQNALFMTKFRLADVLNAPDTRNQIANALTTGVLQYVRTIGHFPTASQVIGVKDVGNNIVFLCR